MSNNKKEIKTVDLKAYAKKQAAEKAKNPSAYKKKYSGPQPKVQK